MQHSVYQPTCTNGWLPIHWATSHCCYWVMWVINALFGETWIPTLNWIPSFERSEVPILFGTMCTNLHVQVDGLTIHWATSSGHYPLLLLGSVGHQSCKRNGAAAYTLGHIYTKIQTQIHKHSITTRGQWSLN